MNEPITLYTYPEAAAILGIKPNTLRKWVADGWVPCVKVGRRAVRFRPRDLEAAIHEHTASGAAR